VWNFGDLSWPVLFHFMCGEMDATTSIGGYPQFVVMHNSGLSGWRDICIWGADRATWPNVPSIP
jgi:hypothetical protein